MYPQFAKYKLPEGDFNYQWYYAMQQMGDDKSAAASTLLQTKLRQREALSSNIGFMFPSIHTLLSMSDLAKTGLKNQLNFQDELVDFHEKKRLYFYPKIFSESPVSAQNWKAFPLEYYTEKTEIDWVKILIPFIGFSLLCLFFGEMKITNLG